MKACEIYNRLKAARKRLAYHSRSGHGATRTKLPAGEAKSIARADVGRLTQLLKEARES
jgi:hypothetical protein